LPAEHKASTELPRQGGCWRRLDKGIWTIPGERMKASE